MVMANLLPLNKDRIEALITEHKEKSLGNKRVAERQKRVLAVKVIKTKGKAKLVKQVLIKSPKQQRS